MIRHAGNRQQHPEVAVRRMQPAAHLMTVPVPVRWWALDAPCEPNSAQDSPDLTMTVAR
jgi:hypothetical protein